MSLRGGLIAAIMAVAAVVRAGDQGIGPRPAPTDYPAWRTAGGLTLAAAVLTPEQVKKRFHTNLNRGYVAVEVAVYPEAGREVNLAVQDFMARFGSDPEIQRPLGPPVIAARLGKKGAPPPDARGKVHVYTTETVGYEHGPYGRSGVYTGTSTAVGIGDPGVPPPPPPAPSGMDRTGIRLELDQLSLPEGKISQATAGYLYFAKPAKGKLSPLHLTYYGEQGQIQIEVPAK